jgi:hypothetical protein
MFVIATDDTYAPKQYFDALHLPARVRVHVVPTGDDGQCAASDVLNRLKRLRKEQGERGDVQEDDQFWMVVDTDHYATGRHTATFSAALKEARDADVRTAVSNPCFELWLLLHLCEVTEQFATAAEVARALAMKLGSYSKTNIPAGALIPHVRDAIERARHLDEGHGGWPQGTGTQVHLLVEQLVP